MKQSLIIMSCLLPLLWQVRAESVSAVAELRVDILPEFDRPAVLVIYHITLMPDTILPAEVHLQIPKQALVNAVAVEDPELGLLNAEYALTQSGENLLLSIVATQFQLQVEYYDTLYKDGLIRIVVFEWKGDFAVDNFSVMFQRPAGVEYVSLEPTPAASQLDKYGLMTYSFPIMSMEQDGNFLLRATYQKTSDDLSISILPVVSSLPLDETNGQLVWSGVLPWIFGGIGLVMLVIGLMAFWGFSGIEAVKPGSDRSLKKSPKKMGKKSFEKMALVYCHECGHRSQYGDRYCRVCGTRLHR